MDHFDQVDRERRKSVSIISKSMLVLGVISIALVPFPSISAAPSCNGLSATVVGTGNSDVLRGTEGNDVIAGRAGDDIIYGSGGNDIICGNGGNDSIYGGSGNDSIYGGTGKDLIYGNEGDDSLFGQGGKDTIDGGSGVNSCESGESVVNCGSTPIPQTDAVPPSVTITSPVAGGTIYGTTTIFASASDNVGVTKVEFYIDGILMGSDSTNTYSLSLDTSTLSNGLHSLTTKAYDVAGNVGSATAIGVNINNTVADTIPPTVSWLSPKDGSTVSGMTNLRLDVRDNDKVLHVQIWIDGSFNGIATHPLPNEIYSLFMNTKNYANGPHTLKALAVDFSGNKVALEITVNISNL